ncbi:MAG: hypothetical protein Q8K36_05705 [Alphaproteobacteria bacterium]|nr:hypothetical protein [Alphaproteobacteria bacterium]
MKITSIKTLLLTSMLCMNVVAADKDATSASTTTSPSVARLAPAPVTEVNLIDALRSGTVPKDDLVRKIKDELEANKDIYITYCTDYTAALNLISKMSAEAYLNFVQAGKQLFCKFMTDFQLVCSLLAFTEVKPNKYAEFIETVNGLTQVDIERCGNPKSRDYDFDWAFGTTPAIREMIIELMAKRSSSHYNQELVSHVNAATANPPLILKDDFGFWLNKTNIILRKTAIRLFTSVDPKFYPIIADCLKQYPKLDVSDIKLDDPEIQDLKKANTKEEVENILDVILRR